MLGDTLICFLLHSFSSRKRTGLTQLVYGEGGGCEGVGLINGGHTLFLGRNAQVVYELQVGEEVEGVRQEVKDEENGEINGEGEPHTS